MATEAANAKAKEFAIEAGKAIIYIYRNETMGAAITMLVKLDDWSIGSTASMTFIHKTVEPRVHTVLSDAEWDSTVEFTAKAGQNYFIWQEVKMGAFSAGSELQIIDENTGKAGVQECDLIL